jgi:hypothetical protein
VKFYKTFQKSRRHVKQKTYRTKDAQRKRCAEQGIYKEKDVRSKEYTKRKICKEKDIRSRRRTSKKCMKQEICKEKDAQNKGRAKKKMYEAIDTQSRRTTKMKKKFINKIVCFLISFLTLFSSTVSSVGQNFYASAGFGDTKTPGGKRLRDDFFNLVENFPELLEIAERCSDHRTLDRLEMNIFELVMFIEKLDISNPKNHQIEPEIFCLLLSCVGLLKVGNYLILNKYRFAKNLDTARGTVSSFFGRSNFSPLYECPYAVIEESSYPEARQLISRLANRRLERCVRVYKRNSDLPNSNFVIDVEIAKVKRPNLTRGLKQEVCKLRDQFLMRKLIFEDSGRLARNWKEVGARFDAIADVRSKQQACLIAKQFPTFVPEKAAEMNESPLPTLSSMFE